MELCPTLEEFGVIIGNHDFGAIILPTLKENPFELAHHVLEVHLSMVKRWCKSKKLNVPMVFKYFTKRMYL